MIGESVPLVMIPRFTSYVGPSTYSTNPLDVSEYAKANLEFWRGELAGSQVTPPDQSTFTAYFEEASDPNPPSGNWTAIVTAITSVNTNSVVELPFTKKFFRIRIVLTATPAGLCAITCWAAGNLERRIPGPPGG
jgi:hypothetical protein